jgi:hypothetical protein
MDPRGELRKIVDDPARRCIDRLAAARCIIDDRLCERSDRLWRLISVGVSLFCFGVAAGAAFVRWWGVP